MKKIKYEVLKKKKYLDDLSKADIEYQLIDKVGGQKLSGAIELKNPIPVAQIPGFFDGACSVQDAGAQVAAELLKLAPDKGCLMRVPRLVVRRHIF